MWQQRACNSRNANKKQAGQLYKRKSMNSIKDKCKKKQWIKVKKTTCSRPPLVQCASLQHLKDKCDQCGKRQVLKGFLRTTCSQFLWMIMFWNKINLDKKYQLRLRLFACWGWSGALWEPATIANSTAGPIQHSYPKLLLELILTSPLWPENWGSLAGLREVHRKSGCSFCSPQSHT